MVDALGTFGLLGTFGFLDYEFTRKMEEQLDAIAEGKEQYRPVVASAYAALQSDTGSYIETTSPKCPVCGKPLVHRFKKDAQGQKGYNFWGCSGYRKEGGGCPATFADDGGKPGERRDNKPKAEPSGHKCPGCRGDLVRRKGISKKTGRPYDFYSCQGQCKVTYNAREDGEPDLTEKPKKK